jgi:hypothetical protein
VLEILAGLFKISFSVGVGGILFITCWLLLIKVSENFGTFIGKFLVFISGD